MNHAHYDLSPWFRGTPYVAESAIQGRGTFADQDIVPGEVVMRLGGHLYASEERSNFNIVLAGTTVGVSEYAVLAKPAEGVRDASDSLNHSCHPNLGMLDSITLVAIRDISKGEELTCDYAYWEVDSDYVMKQPCNCQSASCRRTVTGKDWRLAALSSELLKWASPFVRRRIQCLDSTV